MASTPVIGVIGGSGLYQIDGLENVEWRRVDSPFGEASDELCFGTLAGTRVVFLPRHGRGHRVPPSEINYRANIDALKDRKSTRLNSSHPSISYAVFCLKKKKKNTPSNYVNKA